MWLVKWWWIMNYMSMRHCVVLEMCYYENVINVKVWNMIVWLNPWDKWYYTMSGKMMWTVLSWACNTILDICDFVYLYLFRNMITHSMCVVCVWILWWSRTLCLWEQMITWMNLKNLVLKEVETQCSDRI